MKKKLIFFILIIFISSLIYAQSTSPEEYSENEFSPLFHSIRRTEIITLGSLPFTVLLSNLSYQIIRIAFINHDAGFVNPIAKSSSSSNTFTEKEQIGILAGGIGLSICVGITDTVLSIIKQNKKAKQLEMNNSEETVQIDIKERELPEIKIENPYASTPYQSDSDINKNEFDNLTDSQLILDKVETKEGTD